MNQYDLTDEQVNLKAVHFDSCNKNTRLSNIQKKNISIGRN